VSRPVLTSILILFISATLVAAEKPPVPSGAELNEALALVKEVYGDEYAAAKTATQKSAFAKKLLLKAGESTDPTGRFALLQVAKDAAIKAGDGQAAFKAIDEMDRAFEINAVKMKASVLHAFSKKARSAVEHSSVAEQSLALIDDAIAGDDFGLATKLGEMALAEARKAKNAALLKTINAHRKEIDGLAESYEAVKTALITLETNATDPAANLLVGKYRCFVKGDWKNGIPMLALGSNTALKALAVKELGDVSSASEQVAFGDAWWNLAEKEKGITKTRLQERAAFWYQKALPGLSGLAKDKVEKRLGQVHSHAQPEPERKQYIRLNRVAASFGLPKTDWIINQDVLTGKVGDKRGDPVWFHGQPFLVSDCEFEFKMKAKWYHMISITVDGNRCEYSRGHWQNQGTLIIWGGKTSRYKPGPRVQNPSEWARLKAVLRENTLSLYYNDERVIHEAVSSKSRHHIVLGFGCWKTTVEMKDFRIETH